MSDALSQSERRSPDDDGECDGCPVYAIRGSLVELGTLRDGTRQRAANVDEEVIPNVAGKFPDQPKPLLRSHFVPLDRTQTRPVFE